MEGDSLLDCHGKKKDAAFAIVLFYNSVPNFKTNTGEPGGPILL